MLKLQSPRDWPWYVRAAELFVKNRSRAPGAAQRALTARHLMILFALALAAGCSARGGYGTTGTGGPGTPRSGGTLLVEEINDPASFDMSITGVQRGALHATSLAYNPLLRFKSGPGIDYTQLEIEAALAEKWEVSPDARVYTFHLRKGVKFANLPPVNGREMTSADVKFSYEYWSRTGEF